MNNGAFWVTRAATGKISYATMKVNSGLRYLLIFIKNLYMCANGIVSIFAHQGQAKLTLSTGIGFKQYWASSTGMSY